MTHGGLRRSSRAPQDRGVGEAHRGAGGLSMTRRRFTVAEAAPLRPGRVIHPAAIVSRARLLSVHSKRC
jgi:hypothetical protein